MDYIFIFILGLVIGSFLNVCIYRIPWGESLVYPSSHCGRCGTKLKTRDLVPVASFFMLKGKCRFCGEPISWRYPLVELLTGLLFAAVYGRFAWQSLLIPYLCLTALLVAMSFIDLDTYRIPDRLVLFGFLAGTAFHILAPFINYLDALLGFVLGGGLFFLIALASRGGMGGGDIKLAALIGFFLGWRLVLVAAFLASLLAAITGIMLIVLKKKRKKDSIPFGPFLALGTLLSIFIGREIIEIYAKYFLR